MKKLFILLIAVSLFFSCTTAVYYPNGASAPLLKEKGELQAALGIKGFGGDIRSAYALSDKIGLQLNANILNVTGTEFGISHNSGQYYGEVAVGFYKAITGQFIIEGYIGSGAGTTFSRNLDSDVLRTSNYYKIYAQVDAGFNTKYFKFGLAIREAFVNVYQTKTDGLISSPPQIDAFFEPILFLAIGPERFKVNAQVGISDSQFSSIIDYAPFIVSLGLEAKFSLANPKAE